MSRLHRKMCCVLVAVVLLIAVVWRSKPVEIERGNEIGINSTTTERSEVEVEKMQNYGLEHAEMVLASITGASTYLDKYADMLAEWWIIDDFDNEGILFKMSPSNYSLISWEGASSFESLTEITIERVAKQFTDKIPDDHVLVGEKTIPSGLTMSVYNNDQYPYTQIVYMSLPPWAEHKYFKVTDSEIGLFSQAVEVLDPPLDFFETHSIYSDEFGFSFEYPLSGLPITYENDVQYTFGQEGSGLRYAHLYSEIIENGPWVNTTGLEFRCECGMGLREVNTEFPTQGETRKSVVTHHINQHGVTFAHYIPKESGYYDEFGEGVYSHEDMYVFKKSDISHPLVNIIIPQKDRFVTEIVLSSFKWTE